VKSKAPLLLAFLLFGIVLIACGAVLLYRRQHSPRGVLPLSVSVAKDQFCSNEPITIQVLVTNPLRRRISVHRSSFGLAEYRGADGFYIEDHHLRHKCPPYYCIICGFDATYLAPKESMSETIDIPAPVALATGAHDISYELRIPYYGNEKQFCVAPSQERTIYLDPRDRPRLDVWRDHFGDLINANGHFVVRGKIEFVVK